MRQIKKYSDSGKTEGLASKLASYSAMAAAAIAFTPDVNAQCVAAGGTLPIDIDGDGTPDITISNNTSYFLTYSGTVSFYTVGPYVYGPGPYTVAIPGPAYTSPGSCGPLVNIGDGAWTLNLYTYFVYFAYAANIQVPNFTYIYYNLNYVTAGANQIVGLSAGSSVCAGISSAGATAPATAPALAGFCYSGSYGSIISIYSSYLYYFANFLTASDSEPVSNPAGCTDGAGGILTAFTYYVPPFAIGPYSGFSQIAGPTSSIGYIGPGCATVPALGVEFTSAIDGGTHYGWVTLSIDPSGVLCVDATGWNGCSVEEVAAAGAAAGTECIAVGDATLNEGNEACMAVMPVCNITTSVDVSCDDAGTPGDPSDDMTTVTIIVNNDDPANFPTFSDNMGNAGVAYGAPLVYNVLGDGGLSVTFTDDTDGMCTAEVDVATGCPTEENIPTVGEWGLIMLGLLMSITAIVGIRQRREEEVVA